MRPRYLTKSRYKLGLECPKANQAHSLDWLGIRPQAVMDGHGN